MAEISLEGVTKVFAGGVVAVSDVTFRVEDGEFLVLVGPSGCGKSTLLRMIAGLEETSAGRVVIGGRDVTDAAPRNRDIAMVFQSYALYPHMTVRQNLGYGLKVRKTPKAEIASRIETVAHVLRLEELLDRRPAALSGGQRQRVAMGRAIVRDPKVFLFDEPLSNLDAKLRVAMRAEIKALHQRLKTTTVYVTHDQVEAMTMADRIAVMNDGGVEQLGEPLELYDRPANLFVAQFIGSPAMNIVEGALAKTGGSCCVKALGQQWRVESPGGTDGQPVKYGIRPEHIGLAGQGSDGGIAAEVVVVEPMGSETELVVQVADASLTVVTHGRATLRPGDRISLSPEPGHAHVFDAATGRRI